MVEDRLDTSAASGPEPACFRLRDPEQVADELGRDGDGNYHVSAHTIRKLIRSRLIPFLRGSRGKVLLDDNAIRALLEHMREPMREVEPALEPDWEAMGNPFNFATKAGLGRGRRSGRAV